MIFQAHKVTYHSISTSEKLSETELNYIVLTYNRAEFLACDVHGKVNILKNVFGQMLFDIPAFHVPVVVGG